MELLERNVFLDLLDNQYRQASLGDGHSVFITGEAGIGKSALVREFLKQVEKVSTQYIGACDLLFTPRPLAPLYDIASQMKSGLYEKMSSISSRSELFLEFAQALTNEDKPVIVVFEDIHWADEATLDFIKFFSRRISRSRCLFILTWRDDDVYGQHPLRNVLGHLIPGTYTRVQLAPLSEEAVGQLSEKRGYDAKEVYKISGGNPFYVNEILANYSPGIPDNIKDSVLVIYEYISEETRSTWQLMSVITEGIEFQRFAGLDEYYLDSIANCMAKKILIVKNGKLFFKHELYRRTIEESLSPFQRIDLNKKVLDLFFKAFESSKEIERIVHYAKNANEYDIVVQYAPLAAKQASSVGAHIEASKLYLTAIEYYQGNDKDLLVHLYEAYAYECHLINQLKEAIIYQGKALNIWKEREDKEKLGNCMRFLSRLWWFDGNRKKAEQYADDAIKVLENQPSSAVKAMAYGNMAALKLQSDETGSCIFWGEQAMATAKEIDNQETQAYALNSMGAAMMLNRQTIQRGIEMLQLSMDIAVKNNYLEHVARAYTGLGSHAVIMKEYELAERTLEEGINFCEEKDYDSLKLYMLGWKARLKLETGNWKEAYSIADELMNNESIFAIIKIGVLAVLATIKMRKGDTGVLDLLAEAKEKAFAILEVQRLLPVAEACLEYEWITGNSYLDDQELDTIIDTLTVVKKDLTGSNFLYWLSKTNRNHKQLSEKSKDTRKGIQSACPYEQALILYEKDDEGKRKAISIMSELGADAVYEKLKQDMRNSGIKSIPRGIRKSTKENPALLTGRELDVLNLLQEGIQNKEIAGRLYISPKTVDHHISSILTKLDSSSRSKAVAEAVRLGILK